MLFFKSVLIGSMYLPCPPDVAMLVERYEEIKEQCYEISKNRV